MVAGYSVSTIYEDSIPANGAVAQLGERMTGSHEVRGSIPLGSTNPISRILELRGPVGLIRQGLMRLARAQTPGPNRCERPSHEGSST